MRNAALTDTFLQDANLLERNEAPLGKMGDMNFVDRNVLGAHEEYRIALPIGDRGTYLQLMRTLTPKSSICFQL